MEKFYILTTNALDNDISLDCDEFENEQEVWDYIDEEGHNYDSNIVMNEKKFLNLLKSVITDENVEKLNNAVMKEPLVEIKE